MTHKARFGIAVAATIATVTVLTSRRGIDWANAAERREGGLSSESVWVVTGSHQQRCSRIWTHAVSRQQAWCSRSKHRRQVGIDLDELSR